ncbi:MAG: Flp pilus assembly complex ATPase component, partial [bacterium]|nr:Flp pilus assembly complex ATPase component [bacterium]
MSAKQQLPLIGRLAIQCKMITMEQLQEATREQGRTPERRLGDIFVEKGFVDEAQIHKLKKLQRDLVVKHRARQAATGRTVPERPLPKARASEPAPDGNVLKESVSVESRSVAEPPPERPPEPVPVEVSEPVFEELVVSEPEPVVQAEPDVAEPVAASPAQAAVKPDVAEPVAASQPQAAAKPASKPAAAPAVAQAPQCVEGDSLELRIVEPSSADVEQLHQLLRDAVVKGASDIHLHSMAPSKARINGQLQEVSPTPMDACEVERLVSASLTPTQREELCHMGELDLCYDVDGVGRFRTNIYRQQRGFDAVYRSIPAEPPTLDELGLPNVLAKHTNYHQGMVLVTGPAGCGKSSTMAALVNLINEERDEHILTIEDP